MKTAVAPQVQRHTRALLTGHRGRAAAVCGLLALSACSQLLEYEAPLPGKPSEPPPPASPAPLGIVCGIENAERVAETACAYTEEYCELVASCCAADDFPVFPPVPASACNLEAKADCRQIVRANLAAGSCFDFSLYSAECDAAYLNLFEGCRAISPLGRRYSDYYSQCPGAWTAGNLAPGESCDNFSAQCAAPDDASVAYCFRDWATDSEQPVCQIFTQRGIGETCTEEADSCVDGICSADGVCVLAWRGLPGDACDERNDSLWGECDSGLCEGGRCVDFKGRDCGLGCGRGACGPEGVCEERPLASYETCSIGEEFIPPAPESSCARADIELGDACDCEGTVHVSANPRECRNGKWVPNDLWVVLEPNESVDSP